MVDYDRVHDMVADAFVAHDEDEEPNIDAKKFYESQMRRINHFTVVVEKVSLNCHWLLE